MAGSPQQCLTHVHICTKGRRIYWNCGRCRAWLARGQDLEDWLGPDISPGGMTWTWHQLCGCDLDLISTWGTQFKRRPSHTDSRGSREFLREPRSINRSGTGRKASSFLWCHREKVFSAQRGKAPFCSLGTGAAGRISISAVGEVVSACPAPRLHAFSW